MPGISPLFFDHASKQAPVFGMVGVIFNDRFQAFLCFVGVFEPSKEETFLLATFYILRIKREGFLIVTQRIVGVTKPKVGVAI